MGEYVSAETGTAGELPYHPKHIALVTKITEKTRAGKILWNHTESSVTASVPGELELSFIRGQSIVSPSRGWAIFTLRDKRGNEILRVLGRATLGGLVQATRGTSLEREAVDELYQAIHQQAEDQIQQVIEAIDRI